MPGPHRTVLRMLESLVRRLRPLTLVLVALATVLVGAAVTKLVVLAANDGGGAPRPAAAPLDNGKGLTSWDPAHPPAAVAQGSPTPPAAQPPTPTQVPATPGHRTAHRPAVTTSPVPPPPLVRTYEAESDINTLGGGAAKQGCPACSGGWLIGWVGFNNTLQFNAVMSPATGTAQVTVWYVNGDATRNAQVTVDGVVGGWMAFPNTGDWNTVGSITITIPVVQGANEIRFNNDNGWAPFFDKITVRPPAR